MSSPGNMSSDTGFFLEAKVFIKPSKLAQFSLEGVAVQEDGEWIARIGARSFNSRGEPQFVEFEDRNKILATSSDKLKQLMLVWATQLISTKCSCSVAAVKLERLKWRPISGG